MPKRTINLPRREWARQALVARVLFMSATVAVAMLVSGQGGHAETVASARPEARGLVAIDKVANKIRFYDPVSLRELRVIDSPGIAVHELVISADRKTAYVPLYGDGAYGNNPNPNNKIVIIDLPSMTVTGTIDLGAYRAPHGLAITREGLLWVVCEVPHKLLLIDPVRRTITAAYDSPGKGPHFVALLPDQTKAYISNKEGDLGVFDLARNAFKRSISMPNSATAGRGSEGLTVTPDGARVLVADNDRSELHIIDTATDVEVDRVPLIAMPPTNAGRTRLIKLKLSADGKYLVVVGYTTNQVWIIDPNNMRSQSVVVVAKGPQGIAFSPDGGSVIVSSHDNGLLTRIDLASKKIVESVDGGGGIEALAFY